MCNAGKPNTLNLNIKHVFKHTSVNKLNQHGLKTQNQITRYIKSIVPVDFNLNIL